MSAARSLAEPVGAVAADPYPWPFDGDFHPANTALLVIDMQADFCGPGGYVDRMGYDLSLTRAPIEPIRRVLAAFRAWGAPILHTREGHRPDLSDLPENKRWRSRRIGAGIGDPGPCGRILVRGEPGWEIIPELAPLPGEIAVDKPGKGSFCATDLELVLRTRGIRNLVLTGIECLLVEDATASYFPHFKAAVLEMVRAQGAIVGWTAPSAAVLMALAA